MRASSKRVAKGVCLLFFLLVTAFLGNIRVDAGTASAALPQAASGANWPLINHDANNTNDNPQTVLGQGNANDLVATWMMPFPGIDGSWRQAPGAQWAVEPGSSAPPLLVDGNAYVITDQGTVYALNAADGTQIWSRAITVDYANAVKTVPIIERQVGQGILHAYNTAVGCNKNDTFWCSAIQCPSPVMHRHGIEY